MRHLIWLLLLLFAPFALAQEAEHSRIIEGESKDVFNAAVDLALERGYLQHEPDLMPGALLLDQSLGLRFEATGAVLRFDAEDGRTRVTIELVPASDGKEMRRARKLAAAFIQDLDGRMSP